MRPLDPCERTKDLEKWPAIQITGFTFWDKIADEVGRHLGREATRWAAGERQGKRAHGLIYTGVIVGKKFS